MKLKTLIFISILLLGTMPLLLMVSTNLNDHIQRHEKSDNASISIKSELTLTALHVKVSQVKNDLIKFASLREFEKVTNKLSLQKPYLTSEIQFISSITENWFGKTWDATELLLTNKTESKGLHFIRENGTLTVVTPNKELSASFLKPLTLRMPVQSFTITLGVPPENMLSSHGLQLIFTKRSMNKSSSVVVLAIPVSSFLPPSSRYIWYPSQKSLYYAADNSGNFSKINPLDSPFPHHTLQVDHLPAHPSGTAPVINTISNSQKISWFPLTAQNNQTPPIWIGQILDTGGAARWKRSLIINISIIVLGTMMVVFVIANIIAGKIDKIRQEMINGLEDVLHNEKESEFNWHGLQELTVLGNDLSALAKRYIETQKASRLAAKEANIRQQQLVQADKMRSLGLLISGVAHEINNPNSITLLNTPLLAKSWRNISPILDSYYNQNGDFQVAGIEYSEMREQIPRLFTELEESAVRIKNIVKDLKDYARQDTSNHTDIIELNDVIETAIRLTHNQISKSTDFFSTDLQTVPRVRGSRQKLEQVIINLIQNACDALGSEKATITISSSINTEQRCVSITVEDQGVGMEEEIINQITDPFYTTKRSLGGTGLGLSVSAAIIKEHGGTLIFYSEPGFGTVAQVCLPFANEEGQQC